MKQQTIKKINIKIWVVLLRVKKKETLNLRLLDKKCIMVNPTMMKWIRMTLNDKKECMIEPLIFFISYSYIYEKLVFENLIKSFAIHFYCVTHFYCGILNLRI
jgi:hypothetical protein